MPNLIINNIDVDKLPSYVQDAIIQEFSKFSIKDKLVVYSRLMHGNLFRIATNDIFNLTKTSPSSIYRKFIKNLKSNLKK